MLNVFCHNIDTRGNFILRTFHFPQRLKSNTPLPLETNRTWSQVTPQHTHTHSPIHTWKQAVEMRRTKGYNSLEENSHWAAYSTACSTQTREDHWCVWVCVYVYTCFHVCARIQLCTIIIMHENLHTLCTPAYVSWVFYESCALSVYTVYTH